MALEDYTAQELNVRVGEIVAVLKHLNGWMWCKNLLTQQSGWVPTASLESLAKPVTP
nr:SH3 domain-containing protein [Paenalcaligenes suwonensis]